MKELEKETTLFEQDIDQFRKSAQQAAKQWEGAPDTNAALVKLTKAFEPMAETSRDLIKQTDLIYKLATRLIDTCEKRVQREGQRRLGQPQHHPRPQGHRRSARAGRRTTQTGALLLETGLLAHRTLPRSQTARRGRPGQTGGCEGD